MIRILKILLTGLITSFFIFPFNLPIGFEVNTKMIVAAFGLVIFLLDHVRGKEFRISKSFLLLSLLSIILSLWARVSMSYNHTMDGTYASYFMSLWVWLGGAYAVIWLIRTMHGDISVERIGQYLIGVCVAQCILAYSMTIFPGLHSFIDSLMGDSDSFMGKAEGRMYGLGAALDPTGLRFSAVLIITAFLIFNAFKEQRSKVLILYSISFLIIAVIGNMISRSSVIGVGLSLVLISFLYLRDGKITLNIPYLAITAILFAGILVLVMHFYNTNPAFRSNLRFGFEGFFSLAEKGRWEVTSNNILKNMVVWPETMKTWIIGDGYCDNPASDPNFLGEIIGGYYKGTDIGYLRFIFYFGVPGMLMMVSVFVYVAWICGKRLDGFSILFLFMLISNLICWFKVSSDILMIFAPFLILAFLKEEEGEQEEQLIPASENAQC